MILKILKKFSNNNNSIRKSNSNNLSYAKPFIQWVGGKREMLSQYKKYIPKKFGVYFEPFLGGGTMFFFLKPKSSVLGDISQELIKTYEAIRDNPLKIIKLLKELKNKHSKELYMEIRDIDRKINLLDLDTEEIAARLIYLNQTCFNGVYRVNKNGQFNVPIGSSLNRLICDEVNIINCSNVLKKAIIKCEDFIEIVKTSKKGDFIYLDPPYFPISQYSDFTRYTKEKFYEKDQIRLKESIDKLTKKGSKIMLSNSDCPFIKNLYKGYKQIKVYSNRTLNSKKDRRGKITELLIMNY